MARRDSRFLLALLVMAVAVGAALLAMPRPRERPQLGLMTTLPIYWGEAADLGALLADKQEVHWVRRVLERDYALVPLDTLGDGAGEEKAGGGLFHLRFLTLAQPRALSPQENVALDAWVRQGGRLLLFADPMLTGHSDFAIGDRRRPQDVALLSPILAHWGLELMFDESAPPGERVADLSGAVLPVNLPGNFVLRDGGEDAVCMIEGQGLVAECSIGRGRALIVADAALLEGGASVPAAQARALDLLVRRAFGQR